MNCCRKLLNVVPCREREDLAVVGHPMGTTPAPTDQSQLCGIVNQHRTRIAAYDLARASADSPPVAHTILESVILSDPTHTDFNHAKDYFSQFEGYGRFNVESTDCSVCDRRTRFAIA